MSEKTVIAFRKLVAAMRTLEKEYWAHRDRSVLRKSIELEKRVDETIMKADGSAVPENGNGNFFLLVAELRATTKQYFSEKRKEQPDKELVNSLFKAIKEKEAKIDKQLIRFQDEEIRKQGYCIQYHVMERAHRCPAHSIYHSNDEQLARLELDNRLQNPFMPGTMYFMAKKYIGKDGIPIPIEEIENKEQNNV